MPATQITAYLAPCPTCSGEAYWQASASNNADLTRTTVSYDIDCAGCEDQPVDNAYAGYHARSPMASLRRTA